MGEIRKSAAIRGFREAMNYARETMESTKLNLQNFEGADEVIRCPEFFADILLTTIDCKKRVRACITGQLGIDLGSVYLECMDVGNRYGIHKRCRPLLINF